MNAARIENSPDLQLIMDILRDRQWHSSLDLARVTNSVCIGTRIAELKDRKNEFNIESKSEPGQGRKTIWYYRWTGLGRHWPLEGSNGHTPSPHPQPVQQPPEHPQRPDQRRDPGADPQAAAAGRPHAGLPPRPDRGGPGDIRERAEALADDWEERAAIMEYDGGLSREEAETEAWRITYIVATRGKLTMRAAAPPSSPEPKPPEPEQLSLLSPDEVRAKMRSNLDWL